MLKKANVRLSLLKTLEHFNFPREDLDTICIGFVRPIRCLCLASRDNCSSQNSIGKIQKRACKIILDRYYATYEEALAIYNLKTPSERREQLCINLFKSMLSSQRFCNWVPPTRRNVRHKNLRNSDKISLPICRTKRFQSSPIM